jgi:hypothetical protein
MFAMSDLTPDSGKIRFSKNRKSGLADPASLHSLLQDGASNFVGDELKNIGARFAVKSAARKRIELRIIFAIVCMEYCVQGSLYCGELSGRICNVMQPWAFAAMRWATESIKNVRAAIRPH